MALDRLIVPLVLAAATLAALGLSACGRNGPLELPPGPAGAQPTASASGSSAAAGLLPTASAAPGASTASPQETAAKTGFDAQGNPVAAPGQKKPFILDPLLR